jgi:Zn-dependent peptidase ImmA (M78 family)
MSLKEQTIRRCAHDVLTEIELTTFPVNPLDVAEAKGIRLNVASGFPPDVYGAFYLDESGFGIVISDGCHGDGHRAFTIAHELGHYHIEGHVEAMFPSGSGQVLSMGGHFRDRKSPHEREADWFASELLMPTLWAKPRVHSLGSSLATIRTLVADFGVSLSCAAIRHAELTDEMTAVIVSHKGEIEWAVLSSRLREHKWAARALRREWVPRDTVTRRLSDRPERIRAGVEDASTCYVCEWFEGAPGDVIVDEEAVGLGSFGRVLTVITANDLPSVDELAEQDAGRDWRERDWKDSLRSYSLD